MQAFRPAAAFHDAARVLVDDLHFAAHYDIVDVAMEHEVRLQGLLQVVRKLARRVVIDVVDTQAGLDFRQAGLGCEDGLLRLVELVVFVTNQAEHRLGELFVGIGGLHACAGNDERRARLVDEDGVDLVDDGEVVAALHAGARAGHHVVAQVVETEFGIGAIRHVGLICGDALGLAHAILHQAHFHAQEVIQTAHPLAVSTSEVVVHGNDMHAFAGKRIQITGERRDERFAFAGFHFGDLAFMKRHAANELHVEMAHAHNALTSLAHRGERLGQKAVEAFAIRRTFLIGGGKSYELGVGERLHGRLERADFVNERLVALELLALAKREELRKKSHGLPHLAHERMWAASIFE